MPQDRRAVADALARHPRLAAATLPTPLHRLGRFSDAVGGEVWIKRDDLTGLALGGNKARKIEYILGAAAQSGIDTVVTVGAAQSNHARTVAAAARLAGLACHLVLGGERPPRPSGNLVLDLVLGAELHFAGTEDWDELERLADDLAVRLGSAGARALVVPMGGSTAVGALGFVAAYLEFLDQLDEIGLQPAAVVHATSTGGTQAGLELARHLVGTGPEIRGVGVAKTSGDLRAEIAAIEAEAAALLGFPPPASSPVVLDGYMGAAYAERTDGAERASSLLARTEAIFTDSVYSAKALHAVADAAATAGGPIVFWHTGGVPAIFSDSAGITSWD